MVCLGFVLSTILGLALHGFSSVYYQEIETKCKGVVQRPVVA